MQMELDIQTVREGGIGTGFKVLDPHDGFRDNGQLWFGKCETCGETVTNSWHTGLWEHTVYSYIEYWHKDSLFPNHTRSQKVTYCPTVENKVVEPVIVRKEI
jgi:hypothetical protein